MEIKKEIEKKTSAVKFVAEDNGKTVGRAYLYLIYNGQHEEPYGLLEDVFVEPEYRGKGAGTDLVKAAIKEAKALGCYKLIGTSRHGRGDVHEWYKKIGFWDYGLEFRMDL